MSKKILALVLAGVLAMSTFAGCGSTTEEAAEAEEPAVTEEATADAAPAEEAVAEPEEAAASGDYVAAEEIGATEVSFFAAASLEAVMTDVIAAYNEYQPNVTIVGSYDSSGTLEKQIEEGAACDVFFSAAQKQMNTLEGLESGSLVVDGTRANIVNNQLVVVVAKGATTECTGIESLDKAESLAIADGTVPVGKYTRKALVALGILGETDTPEDYTTQDLSDALGGVEISEQSNVSKVRQAVIENPGQVGTIYYSDYYGHEDELDIIETVSYDYSGKIIYPVAQIVNTEADETESAAAVDFINFIKSNQAKAIFDQYLFDTENLD